MSLSRVASRRRFVTELLLGGPLSAEALGEETGLSAPALRQAIEALEAEGVVERLSGRFGLRAAAGYGLAVDLGGTKVAAALADAEGAALAEAAEPTDPRGGRHVLRQIRDLAARLAAAQGIALSDIGAVAIGMPGVVDPGTGAVSLGPNIAGLADLNVRAEFSELFGRLALVENDVNLAALGEVWRGGARGGRNVGFLALGTGIGLGLVVNGALARGANGAAGEIAYLPLGAELETAAAREIGSLELDIGSAGILARYRARGGRDAETVRGLFALGDAHASAALDEAAAKAALAIVALQAVLDLEKIVLGGGIGARPEFCERVRSAMAKVFARPVDIAVSVFGERAGLVGALGLATLELRRRRLGLDEISFDFAEAQA